jgi:hypothetical protein
VLAAAPFLVFVYVLGGLIAARSENPLVLERYSLQAATLILVCLAVFAAAVAARMRNRQALAAGALIALAAVTLIMPGSNAVQRVPYVQYVLPLVRLLVAAALIGEAAARFRRERTAGGPLLAAAMALAVWAVTDIGLAAITRATPPHARASTTGFRHAYELDEIPPDAVVLIGDSFVWGQGVAASETFGDRLEQRFRADGMPRSVYSLGIVGGGLTTYLQVLSQLPSERRVDRIALVYYVNDMPPKPRALETFRNQMITLGAGAPTLRLIGDVAGRSLAPTLEQYHALLVEDYDPSSATYERRWNLMAGQLAQFHALAGERSGAAPLLVILPLMVEFASYPLTDAHARLTALGRRLGYDVVDLLPVFRERLGDGRQHLVSAEDNHFDAATHAIVAGALHSALASP